MDDVSYHVEAYRRPYNSVKDYCETQKKHKRAVVESNETAHAFYPRVRRGRTHSPHRLLLVMMCVLTLSSRMRPRNRDCRMEMNSLINRLCS